MSATIPKIVIWADGGASYPAGSDRWASTPVNVAPIGNYLTPKTPAGAQTLNYILNQATAAAQAAINLSVCSAVANWEALSGYATIDGTANGMGALAFHPGRGVWIGVTNYASPAFKTWMTHDNGRTWSSEAPTAPNPALSLWCDSQSERYLVFCNGTLTAGFIDDTNTGTLVLSLSAVSLPSVTLELGGVLYFFGGDSASGLWHVYTAQGTGTPIGSSWANVTATLPGPWGSSGGTGTIEAVLGDVSPSSDPYGARILVALMPATPGTDLNRLLLVDAFGTYTDLGAPAAFAGKVIRGVCYSEYEKLWLVLSTDGTNSYIHTAADPLAGVWNQSTVFGGASSAGAIAAVGAVRICQIKMPPTNGKFVVYSDNAGSSWHVANAVTDFGFFASSGRSVALWTLDSFSFAKAL